MENSSEHVASQEQTPSSETLLSQIEVPDSTPQEQTSSPGTNPINLGLALVVAFALGLALGFFGRPAIIAENPTVIVETVVIHEEAVAQSPTATAESLPATEAPSADSDSLTEPAEQPADAAPTPTIMEFVMSDARHWQGDDSAPITIVEFSDFK